MFLPCPCTMQMNKSLRRVNKKERGQTNSFENFQTGKVQHLSLDFFIFTLSFFEQSLFTGLNILPDQ